MKKFCIIFLVISTALLASCSKPNKKDLYDIKIGNKTINLKMSKTELSKIYGSHKNDSGTVYFFLDNKDRDNYFNATFYPNGKIKTLYSMSETTPVIKFLENIYLGMSKKELNDALAMKYEKNDTDLYLIKFTNKEIDKINCFNQHNKKDENKYVNLLKKKGTYLELFVDENVIGAVRVICNL